MARPRREDLLQSNRFWLIDISPSRKPPFFVLGGPLWGFQTCSAPEVTVNTHEIRQGNSLWATETIKDLTAGAITMTRGSRILDRTFYEWVMRSARGEDRAHRHLLLVQYTSIVVGRWSGLDTLGTALGAITGGLAARIGGDTPDPMRIPGKAWILFNCIPKRYKPGTDFDAATGDVSIQEIEVQPQAVLELGVGI